MTTKTKNGNVPWAVFAWAIGIMFLIFTIFSGIIFGIQSQTKENGDDIIDLQVLSARVDEKFNAIMDRLDKIEGNPVLMEMIRQNVSASKIGEE